MPSAAQTFPDAESLANDKGIDLEVCQCSHCGLVQLSNEPVPYYKDVIRAAAVSPEMKEFRLRQFSGFVQRFSLQGKKIVEIGCGRGEYLSLMQQCGVEAHGLEHAAESVADCLRGGLRVSQGYVQGDDFRASDAPFDAFYILNFFEHLPDPNSTLAGIRNILTEDAVGLVEVPNFDMILRKNLFSEFVSDHLTYFTAHTLQTTLACNGYDTIDCREEWHEYLISATVKKRKRLDLSHFADDRARIKAHLDDYIRRFPAKKVAIWGAGHQALTIIAMMQLADTIRYVVDSAPFKQGKYTPATHLPIVAPETLNSDPVDAVIVIAASYSDEVVRILRQRFPGIANVSILRNSRLEEA
jgi:SAM-dependent methyltransferase